MHTFSSRLLIALMAVLLLGTSAWAQRKPRIRGNRSPVDVSESLPPFRRIMLADDLEVRLLQRDSEGYGLHIDDNLVDILQFQVQDSTLVISSFYEVTGSRAMEITIFFRELSGIDIQAGRLVADTEFTSDVLRVQASGAARLEVRARASLFELDLSENSGADLNLAADSLSLRMTDRSDAVVYTDNGALSAGLSGNADLTLEGISGEAVLQLSGESGITARKLVAERLEVLIDGAATARVHAGTSLVLDAAGQSRTYLYGTPELTIRRFADRAELHKEPD
ncbi:GIN domain-containing protein [Robiginitalea sp. SC105]|uniref:GIN domain-containing protein n=1 Tax=Robiginitalea sp. SC105 TaxID=2762332 RepID=UPI001639E226|nr:DUF2807 domain-containing protein [Robiginitalea sp. SC105]MBC2838765.1 DUF2807 domain-containing protein [Robiginitalea sp. SC105]